MNKSSSYSVVFLKNVFLLKKSAKLVYIVSAVAENSPSAFRPVCEMICEVGE